MEEVYYGGKSPHWAGVPMKKKIDRGVKTKLIQAYEMERFRETKQYSSCHIFFIDQ